MQGKMAEFPHVKKLKRKEKPCQRIHSDVCGPMDVESIGRSKYFVTFLDDATRFCKVYFIRSKTQVFEKLQEFKNYVKNQFD